jgi:hypothetical protein
MRIAFSSSLLAFAATAAGMTMNAFGDHQI